MLRSLDLFTGAGGFTVGLRSVARPVAYCEIDPSARDLLLRRMRDGRLPAAPIIEDVRRVRGKIPLGRVDLITAGFPCQDVSVIGPRLGIARGKRSSLIGEVLRVTRDLRPLLLLLENVPPIVGDPKMKTVVQKLRSLGYDVAYAFFEASALGALHRRKRWFLLATKVGAGIPPRLFAQAARDFGKLKGYLKMPGVPAVCDGADAARCIRHPSEGPLWGNAVVPAAVCQAFAVLLRRLTDPAPAGGVAAPGPFPLPRMPVGYLWTDRGVLHFPDDAERFERRHCGGGSFRVTVSPNRFWRQGSRGTRKQTRRALSSPYRITCLPTPRTGAAVGRASGLLTERTKQDLPLVVFASNLVPAATKRRKDYVSNYRVSHEWLARLMGFPPGWAR